MQDLTTGPIARHIMNTASFMLVRMRATFAAGSWMAISAMAVLVVLSHVAPGGMVRVFSDDASAVAVGEDCLRIVLWNFIASGLVFVSSSMFQAIGNTLPSLMTSFSRILLVAVPLYFLSRMPGFELRWIWYLSVAAVLIQMTLNLLLLMREFRIRLKFDVPSAIEMAR